MSWLLSVWSASESWEGRRCVFFGSYSVTVVLVSGSFRFIRHIFSSESTKSGTNGLTTTPYYYATLLTCLMTSWLCDVLRLQLHKHFHQRLLSPQEQKDRFILRGTGAKDESATFDLQSLQCPERFRRSSVHSVKVKVNVTDKNYK